VRPKVPPLISREEALRLGQIEDHAEIEALVERAWRVRLERFGDSTDMFDGQAEASLWDPSTRLRYRKKREAA
jgi:hypothetical protein